MNYNGLKLIHPDAKIGKNLKCDPFVTISKDVVIGDNCWIGSNVCIMDGVRIGNNCKIFPGAIVGAVPQDLKFAGEESYLEIGNNVTIREYCTINRGTLANVKTIIGDNCLLMAYVHVAHDCHLHENVILANNTNLAGHIVIGKNAILGGLTAVHQFVRIGQHTMIGGGALVRKDVPPYVKAAREPLSYAGVNSIGLRRRGFNETQVTTIQDIYRILYVKGYNTTQALSMIEDSIPATEEREIILDFIHEASRGIMRGFKNLNANSKKAKVNGKYKAKANGTYTG